ncbi:MAG TPA: hypothetical protein VLJ39_14330, partial [Tepidisphaeraceae bacterium]|nr:hypothetical protein [Tepidisphaeraceae bacterium]
SFDRILVNGCGCDDRRHDDCGTPCAVPLPAAAQQGLVGFGALGLFGLAYSARRRMLARSA